MKYEMPILTDEQREEIEKLCIDAVSERPIDREERLMHLIAQVSLAALTAENREATLTEDYEDLTASKPPRFAAIIALKKLGIHTKEAKDFLDAYTRDSELLSREISPPVPAMKPIVLNSDETDSPIDWYAGAKTRVMVIDTLRAAGYEVKE